MAGGWLGSKLADRDSPVYLLYVAGLGLAPDDSCRRTFVSGMRSGSRLAVPSEGGLHRVCCPRFRDSNRTAR